MLQKFLQVEKRNVVRTAYNIACDFKYGGT